MEFWDVIKKRHCQRSFSKKEVSDDLIEKIILAGKMAPSAGGIYPVEFFVVRDEETKEALAEAALGQDFVAQAPVVLVIASDLEKSASRYGDRGRYLYAIQDADAAAENIFLAVTNEGLDTCWVGAFDEEEVKKILNLRKNLRPLVIMPIGYEGKSTSKPAINWLKFARIHH